LIEKTGEATKIPKSVGTIHQPVAQPPSVLGFQKPAATEIIELF
jgi:hypothetical protein